jgi:hypothetical protein
MNSCKVDGADTAQSSKPPPGNQAGHDEPKQAFHEEKTESRGPELCAPSRQTIPDHAYSLLRLRLSLNIKQFASRVHFTGGV